MAMHRHRGYIRLMQVRALVARRYHVLSRESCVHFIIQHGARKTIHVRLEFQAAYLGHFTSWAFSLFHLGQQWHPPLGYGVYLCTLCHKNVMNI